MTLILDTLLDAQDRLLKQNLFLIVASNDRPMIIAGMVEEDVSFHKMRHIPGDTLHITTANGLDIYFSDFVVEGTAIAVQRTGEPAL